MVGKIKKFRTIAFYASKKGKREQQIIQQLEEIILNLDLKILYPSSSLLRGSSGIKTVSDNYVIKQADLVMAIGGDGTLLSCSREFGKAGLPILGINLGNLGFLNDIPPNDLTNSLIEILEGNYILDNRFFLKAGINGELQKDIALNEIVIHSGSIAQLIEYDVFVDETFVYRQRADGLIISTQTGSTAYALSGNGPIIHPSVNAICLLPMFPHSLNTRPLIVHENVQIRVIVNKKSYISFDSHITSNLKKGDEVLITKTDKDLNLVHPTNHNFYNACRTKLGWSLGVPNKINTDQ